MAIKIYEQDQTNAYAELTSTDVVYVPGFSAADLSETGNTYAKVNVPTLCSSIVEFEAAFGKSAPYFAAAQEYPKTDYVFTDEALSGMTGNWFEAGDVDPSYVYAKELINAGIPVIYERLNKDASEITVINLYDSLFNKVYIKNLPASSSIVDETDLPAITDKSMYTVKYLTSGGYPSFEMIHKSTSLSELMAKMAKFRGDCIALIDPTDNNYRALIGDGSVIKSVRTAQSTSLNGQKLEDGLGIFASMIYPWCEVKKTFNYSNTLKSESGRAYMPGSFVYLSCLAKSIKNNPNWYAIAGVVRGVIPNLLSVHHNNIITNKLAEYYQSNKDVSINPIEFVRDSGYCIMGNRTMAENKDGCTVLSYLSNRNAANDIKKEAFKVCNLLKFEQNTDVLWSNFKAEMRPLLDKMVSGSGLKGYRFIKNSVNPTDGSAIPETKISAIIRVQPVYAVEDFDIYVQLTDDDVVEVE